jgi:hypothetical protein
MGDENPGDTRPMGGAEPEGVDAAALLRKPAIIAAIGAVFGLGMGIVIGRSTVPEPAAPARGAPPSKSEAALTPVVEEEEPEPQRSNEYRVQLGRRVPGGKSGRGFEKHRVGARPVARLAETDGSIRFDLDAKASDYLLTAVIHLDAAKPGKLAAQLDGKPLAVWEIEPGWQMYSTRISHDRLEQADHLLHVSPALPGGGEVSIDSLAAFPVASDLNIGMGSEAVGLVIDGFSNLGGRSVWSVGPRSVVGVALAPAAGPYRLTVRGSAFEPIAPLLVSCRVNGKNVGAAEIGAKVADVVWQIDANLLRDGVNRIEFAYPKTAQPAAIDPGSKDKRELAMRFARLELVPNQ